MIMTLRPSNFKEKFIVATGLEKLLKTQVNMIQDSWTSETRFRITPEGRAYYEEHIKSADPIEAEGAINLGDVDVML